MSAVTRSLLRYPTPIDIGWPTGMAVSAMVLYILGYAGNPAYMPWLNVVILSLLGVALLFLTIHNYQLSKRKQPTTYEVEKTLLFVATAFILVRTVSGWGIDAYPLIYVTLALLVAIHPGKSAWCAVGAALLMEWGAYWVVASSGASGGELSSIGSTLEVHTLGLRSFFIVTFASLAYLVHGREVLALRRAQRAQLAEAHEQMMREAREFRLLHCGSTEGDLTNREQAEELIVRDAVDAVHQIIYLSLSLLKTTMNCHTSVLLWFDARNESMHIKELVSDSDSLVEGPIDPARGVLGGITRRRELVSLDDIRPGFRGLSYYRDSHAVNAFVGVPVIEKGHLRGVLCVDRINGQPFTREEEQLVQDAADYIMRSVENERMFTSIEKTRYELGRFYEASRQLNGVLTPQDVYRVALECVGQIVDYDFAAITLYNEHEETHTIGIVDCREPTIASKAHTWQGRAFNESCGLVSMVIKNRHYLPFGGQVRESSPIIFSAEEKLESIKSLIVLPLIVQDRALGTLVIADSKANAFSKDRRKMLEVISHQVGVTLQNASLYAKMEEMATLDGLTQLANRRTFQSRLDEALARARRKKRSLSLILLDVDHFKPVNDTYGHSVGDEVLRQVSACLRNGLREIDVPARYGGEEFVILMEETEMSAAIQVADRLREEVSKLVFTSEQGPFSCTVSMGVASFPDDADLAHHLIDAADEALYYSKEHGRNRVTSYREMAKLKGKVQQLVS